MDQLWAPWRMKYIQDIDKKDEGCIFCTKPAAATAEDRSNLILHRGASVFVLMNLYPYNNGHLMVIPYQHTSDMLALPAETAAELWSGICLCKEVLTAAFHPEGFNIGMNIGRVAGAGIDQHVHMHIVPRWNGDTNFMPVIGKTKVLSQGIEDTYDQLKPYFRSLTGNASASAPS
jgi:ATP adenylyltransferase